jgi:hypothetical protein
MTDINPFVDSSESTGKTTKAFEEKPLTFREHEDGTKHYIGESLPVPSLADMLTAGQLTSVGTSIFPARSDHSHDVKSDWAIYNHANRGIAVGQTFMNNWNYIAGPVDFRVSGQIFQAIKTGVHYFEQNYQISRDVAGTFQNHFNLVSFYYNGTYQRPTYRTQMTGIPSPFYVSVSESVYMLAGQNIQFAFQQNDTSNWSVIAEHLMIARWSG